MDWGLGNPNITAALIATLAIAVLGLAHIRKWGFWVALSMFTGLGICLIHTFSRGGMVALGAGLLPSVWQAPRPWHWKRIIAAAVAVWVIVGASIFLQANHRYMQGIVKEDRSITHRLDIWKKTPQMMADAPGGWGLGRASKAYHEWYQPLERNESYLNLINSHLTWLVEIGWGWRFLYLFGWLMVFPLCWPSKDLKWFAIPLGIWLAFFVAAIFTHVAESPWLWILPGLSLAAVLVARFYKRFWPRLWVWPVVACIAAISLGLICWIGASQQELKIRGNARQVVIGNEASKTWIVINPALMGENYGKTLRRYLRDSKERPSIGIADKVEDLPNQQEITVVVAGPVQNSDLARLKAQSRLILLNPMFSPQEIDFKPSKSVTVYFGEFSQSPAIQSWRDLGVVHPVEGSGDFLANWPELVFNRLPPQ